MVRKTLLQLDYSDQEEYEKDFCEMDYEKDICKTDYEKDICKADYD